MTPKYSLSKDYAKIYIPSIFLKRLLRKSKEILTIAYLLYFEVSAKHIKNQTKPMSSKLEKIKVKKICVLMRSYTDHCHSNAYVLKFISNSYIEYVGMQGFDKFIQHKA